jgi:single-stranded-DNA-specific exonuclease
MQSLPPQWILRNEPLPPEAAADDAGVPRILSQLLRQRGIHGAEQIRRFLHPRLKDLADPFLIPGMHEAVERLLRAVDRKEQVCIFGDYDVDGVTSITLMRRILGAYGLASRYFVPIRGSEGYGLGAAALERCMSEGPKPDLLVTVDCGTASVDEIQTLRREGIDVVVVDHHEPGPKGAPDCQALVNPKLVPDGDFTYLCAAGVTFKLAHALLKTRPVDDFDLKQLIEFVAVATIADIVPLVGENRILVRQGLSRLPETLNPGLRALQEITGMNGRATSSDVGFRLGPRLNAAGRMDAPLDALATLLTDSRRLANGLALKLDGYNRERQSHELRIRREAIEQLAADGFDPLRDPVIVLGSRGWHPGVVGIVASRLMRQFHKPAFVVAIDSDGIGKGSGRSIEGVSLVDVINDARDLLVAGGGHGMAAGISVHEDLLSAFRERFAAFVLRTTTPEQRRPRLLLDAELTLDQLSLEFLGDYELLQPFGNGNPQPLFFARRVELGGPPEHLKNSHLRLSLRQGIHEHEAMFFGGGERQLPDPPWDVAFTIDRNTFRGRTQLQMTIQEVRSA